MTGDVAQGATPRQAQGALRSASTRAALRATARREARLARGRDHFLWRERVLPIGMPLGAAIGAAVWTRERHRPRLAASMATGAVVAAVAVSFVGALIEWELFERGHRRATGRIE